MQHDNSKTEKICKQSWEAGSLYGLVVRKVCLHDALRTGWTLQASCLVAPASFITLQCFLLNEYLPFFGHYFYLTLPLLLSETILPAKKQAYWGLQEILQPLKE